LYKGNSSLLDKGTDPHQTGDNHNEANIGWGHLKFLFSKTDDQEKLRFS
jgi:hypothetical protein